MFALRCEPGVALILHIGGFCKAGAVSSLTALSVIPSRPEILGERGEKFKFPSNLG